MNYSSWSNYKLELKEDNWEKIELVSVDKNDNVIGFLVASIDRDAYYISSLLVANFYDINITFSKDFKQFLSDLFIKYKFNKVCFSVVISNPAEKMYDKYIKRYNGRIVGVQKEHAKLADGNYYDVKLYEILRKEYLDSV